MANTLTPQDVYALVNEIVHEATGRSDLAVVDTSSFVSVGETLLRTSAENTLSAISTVLARTIFSTRVYKGKFDIMRASQERWGGIVRKVITLPLDAEQSQDWNTQLAATQLNDGNSVDMYKIRKPKVIQLNFYGTKVLQSHITRFRDQLSMAFKSEAEFISFINAVMTEFNNDIERLNEAEARAVVLNVIGGISSMGLYEVDLTAEYNTKFGTQYTRDELLTTYLESFMKFFVAEVKKYSDRLTDSTSLYHANLSGLPEILHHTPKAMQKMLMYKPMFTDAEASVFSTIFNPKYLEIGDFEGVNFWQDPKDPMAVNVKPNILDVATGESKTAENAVELDAVVGLLYDQEAFGIWPQFAYSSTTPFNSAGGYYNDYVHWRFNSWTDYTENMILFVMGEGGPADTSQQ